MFVTGGALGVDIPRGNHLKRLMQTTPSIEDSMFEDCALEILFWSESKRLFDTKLTSCFCRTGKNGSPKKVDLVSTKTAFASIFTPKSILARGQ